MHFCHVAANCLLLYTHIAFYTLHYGSIRRLVPSRNSSTHLYFAKLRCRQTAVWGVTRGERGAQFPGLWITMRTPNYCGGRRKLKMSRALSSIRYICFRKNSGSNMRGQTCSLPRASSNLIMPLTADSRTALATALKLFFCFHFGGFWYLESVISFPYCIPIFTAAFPFEAVIRHLKK